LNGDSQKIYDAIKDNGVHISKIYTKIEVMETKQILQHKQNSDAIKKIIGENDASKLKHTRTSAHIKIQWAILACIFFGLITIYIKAI
jgi:hypothetical protein